ncbi:hypothetical protein [Paenarthrobacter nitroguajacolicus]|uniref:hypothetical protein n=1 Tax=Paenarthrobacter nitroguajacolicus TaxID=211146 RepID=UPI00248BFA9C|nr:hypothetical protein [Paenarthrobacter nitroguajacolicus]MDI2036029.1 hypothetical protein [Paenarthrobacter nitroguajacolicus]
MDPIKNQISAIDPLANESAEINSEEALARMLTGPRVFSDNNPAAGVVSLEDRRRRKARIAGGLLLGAAAVTAGVLVAANFGPLTAAPAPAVTVATTEATPTPSASATPTPTATPSATPSATPEPTVPVSTPSEAPTAPAVAPTTAPTQPPVANPQKFTFPDGHLSFTLPVGWTAFTEQGPYLSEETKAASQGATILDATGTKVAVVNSGFYGDGTAGEVTRTVHDRAVVPGLTDISGNPVEFGFAADQSRYVPYEAPAGSAKVLGDAYYFMDVRLASELKSGETTSGTNQIRMPNGVMNAYVVFDYEKQPIFATPEAAKAWMGSTQYAQLKGLLLSLRYQ